MADQDNVCADFAIVVRSKSKGTDWSRPALAEPHRLFAQPRRGAGTARQTLDGNLRMQAGTPTRLPKSAAAPTSAPGPAPALESPLTAADASAGVLKVPACMRAATGLSFNC